MRIFYVHFIFFIFFILITVFSVAISLLVTFRSQSFFLSFNLYSFWNIEITFRLYIDFFSSWFSSVVLFIRRIVIIYSYSYISPYSKPFYFLSLTSLFVVSILIVIFFSNLFFVMLGWDGLGLISFFLILFYQNPSSISRGCFTLIINRVGDSLFLVTLTYVFILEPSFTPFFLSPTNNFLVIWVIVVCFITKRALYPFSPWLPEAIAAPTPISSLVHSSTLVTAGFFLIIRYSYFIYSSYPCIVFLLLSSLFTSFYAGVNALFEIDLKKLIALSTLSHLGFIGIAFSVGLPHLCFFHMVTHALFKSLLFIRIGDVIKNLSHSQDIRFLSQGMLLTPTSRLLILLSLLNLLGLPFIRGFFSKDLVLEIVACTYFSFVSYLLIVANLVLTYLYSYKLFNFFLRRVKTTPFLTSSKIEKIHLVLLLALRVFIIRIGLIFQKIISCFFYTMVTPLPLKIIPLMLSFLVFIFFFTLLVSYTPKKTLVSLRRTMLLLRVLAFSTLGALYKSLLFESVKTFESGALIGVFTLTPTFLSAYSFINLSFATPSKHLKFILPLIFFICLFSLL